MKRNSNYLLGLLMASCVVSLLSFPVYVGAQDDGEKAQVQASDADNGARSGRPAWGRNANGERRNFDPAQMLERRLASMQKDLGSPDDEWAVLKPLVEKVYKKQMEVRRYRVAGRARTRPGTDEIKEVKALREALDNEKTSPEVLKEKLDAFRKVRDKAGNELDAAQEELRKVLTVRQEAKLVAEGLLE
jgi:hypothetical protein